LALYADLDTEVRHLITISCLSLIGTSSNIENQTSFPAYTPKDNKFSIWGESYGGHYVPTFSDFFETQNQKIVDGKIDGVAAVPLYLETVGLVNACIDIMTQMPFYPEMAHNNTYGIRVSNDTEYKLSVEAWPACQAAIESCRSLGDEKDPDVLGTNDEVNKKCKGAFDLCYSTMRLGYNELEVGPRSKSLRVAVIDSCLT